MIIAIFTIGLLFSWWAIWFYKFHWSWYLIAIPMSLAGFVAFVMFAIERLIDFKKNKNGLQK